MPTYRIFYADPKGMREQALHEAWNKMQNEKLVRHVFYDGLIQTYDAFRAFMRRPATLPFVLFRDRELVGFFWINNFVGRTAQIHFTGYRNSIGTARNAPDIGRSCVCYALCIKDDSGYFADTIIGITPVTNRLAVRYNERAGMIRLAEIPGRCEMYYDGEAVNGVLTYATRETMGIEDFPDTWEGGAEPWRKQ